MKSNDGTSALDLPSCCWELLVLLTSISKCDALSTADTRLFQQLWNNIVQLQRALPPPESGTVTAGRDNYGREYRVEAVLFRPGGVSFERRFFPGLEATGFHYSAGPKNYLYYNPEGDFYASYLAVQVGGSGEVQCKVKGIKLSDLGLTKYTYPPDIPTSERGGQAERYIGRTELPPIRHEKV